MSVKPKAKRETFLLRVSKGALVPDDSYTADRLRMKGYRIGDVLSATLRKPRSPGFHRLAHAFGRLCADNLDRFTGMNAHVVLKTVQYEADIACDRLSVNLSGFGLVEVRLPKSLSFESMDEGEFNETFKAMCRHVAEKYWHDCTPEQIADMASAMPEAA